MFEMPPANQRYHWRRDPGSKRFCSKKWEDTVNPVWTRWMLLGMCLSLLHTPAKAQTLTGPCPVGKQVTDEQNKTGTVVDTDPVGCHVQFPDGSSRYYLSWMLHLAGTPAIDPRDIAAIKPGRYTCYAGNPLHYVFMDINIKSSSSYTDVKGAAGSYSYDPKTQLINFTSGSFKGEYAKYLGKEGIGLSATPGTFFATVCDLEK